MYARNHAEKKIKKYSVFWVLTKMVGGIKIEH